MGNESRRFDSWKEVAAYFGRDERTVRRWEKNEALPVHRHHHHSRGSVYAFQDELDQWLASRGETVGAAGAPPPRPSVPIRRVLVLAALGAAVGLALWAFMVRQPAPAATADAEDATASRWLSDPLVRRNFLLARHHLDRRAGFRREAREYLEAAIKQAPEFAEAHALLGEAYLREALAEPAVRAAAWSNAETAVRRALALDERLALAHATISRIALLRDWDWPTADAESTRATALAPDSPHARSARALYLRASGRVAEAILEREHAHRADPTNPQWLVFLGDEFLFARRYQDAIDAYSRSLELERNYAPAVDSLADAYARQGKYGDAAEWRARAIRLRQADALGLAFDEVRQRGGPEAALQWLDRRDLEELGRAADGNLWNVAYLHARLGHREEALDFLQRAFARHEVGLLQARVDPDLDSLRTDPRFIELLARVGPK